MTDRSHDTRPVEEYQAAAAEIENEDDAQYDIEDEENAEQADEGEQAQTVADEAIDRSTSVFGLSDSEKARGGIEDVDAPDLIDHMNQMVTSGQIDNSAYLGEDNHDDNVDKYGRERKIDDLPGDGSDGR